MPLKQIVLGHKFLFVERDSTQKSPRLGRHYRRRWVDHTLKKPKLEENCGLETRRGSRTCDSLNCARETSSNLFEVFWKCKVQYDQGLVDIRFECDSLQALLVTSECHNETSRKSLCVAFDLLEVCLNAVILSHLH